MSVQDGNGGDHVDGEDDIDVCRVDDGDDRYRCALWIDTEPARRVPGEPGVVLAGRWRNGGGRRSVASFRGLGRLHC